MKKFFLIIVLIIVCNTHASEYLNNPYVKAAGVVSAWGVLNYSFFNHRVLNSIYYTQLQLFGYDSQKMQEKIIKNKFLYNPRKEIVTQRDILFGCSTILAAMFIAWPSLSFKYSLSSR